MDPLASSPQIPQIPVAAVGPLTPWGSGGVALQGIPVRRVDQPARDKPRPAFASFRDHVEQHRERVRRGVSETGQDVLLQLPREPDAMASPPIDFQPEGDLATVDRQDAARVWYELHATGPREVARGYSHAVFVSGLDE